MDAAALKAEYDEFGFVLAPSLFSLREIAAIRDRFEEIWEAGVPGYFERDAEGARNACERYPRIIHPHRFDDLSRRVLLDARIETIVGSLLDDEPIAAQTMYYWKPPGTPGQAPHQDNLYLQADDAAGCIAAWIAIDECDEGNGCLVCVPGSHRLELLCPGEADPTKSFSGHHVQTPDGMPETAVTMSPGDCLFFGGLTIHGSGPNQSSERFRRSFICHYIGARSTKSASFYNPLIRFSGEEFCNEAGDIGNPCGVAIEGPH
jgi:ectoine hydroxylase-related dioxygenase (phytanoyl-CoA dioxygenase family)